MRLCSAIIRRGCLSVNRETRESAVCHDCAMLRLAEILIQLFADTLRLCGLAFRSSRSIKAENLFLRRQLGLYIERGVKPRRIDPVTRISLTVLSRLFSWRDALVVVRPETLIRWHCARSRLLCPLKSRPSRPPSAAGRWFNAWLAPATIFGGCEVDLGGTDRNR